jgi:tetratricopeptide (TPR) repeat protein
MLTGETNRAVALVRQALAAVDRTAAPLLTGALLERLARYRWMSGDSEAAMRALEEAVAIIPAEPPSPERARCLAAHGQLLLLRARNAAATSRCQEAIAMARQVGARTEEGHALNTLGAALGALGQVDQGIARLRQARRIAEEVDDPEDLCRADHNLTDILLRNGRAEAALAAALQARQVAAQAGSAHTYGAGATAHATEALVLLGRWPEAERLLSDELDLEPPAQGRIDPILSFRYEHSSASGSVPVWSRSPRAAMTALPTSAGSRTSASSTIQAPPRKPRARSAAVRIARRVLPTPPGPTRLTRQAPVSFRLSSASSRRRPMKLDASAGRLPDGRAGLAIVKSNVPRPQAAEAGRLGASSVIPPISALRRPPRLTRMSIARLPCGRWTKWAVLAAWVVVFLVAGPLAGRLPGAEKNDPSASLPKDAESTRVVELARRFTPAIRSPRWWCTSAPAGSAPPTGSRSPTTCGAMPGSTAAAARSSARSWPGTARRSRWSSRSGWAAGVRRRAPRRSSRSAPSLATATAACGRT